MSTRTIRSELKKFKGYDSLNNQSKKLVEYNFLEILGQVNIVIDQSIWKNKSFIEKFLKDLIDLNVDKKTYDYINKNNTNQLFINYEEDKYKILDYKGIVRPINIIIEDTIKDYKDIQDDDIEIKNHLPKPSNESTVILLGDHDDIEKIIKKHIRLKYSSDSYIIIVDDEFPEQDKLPLVNLLLNYDYHHSELDEAIENIRADQQIIEAKNLVEKDIKDKHNHNTKFDNSMSLFEETVKKIVTERKKLKNLIVSYEKQSLEDVKKYLDNETDTDIIIEKIESKNVSKKRESQKTFAQDFLEEKVEYVNTSIKSKVEKFNKVTEESLDQINYTYTDMTGLNVGNNISSWFASGLLGLGSYGALAIYMSSLGNLGGYLLVAKGVSLLASFGISVGGTAAAIKGISILGGPIGIAIGLGLTTMLVSKSLMGIGWKKSLAKKIRNNSIKNILPKIEKNVNDLWSETNDAVDKGFDSIIKNASNDLKKTFKESLSQEQIKSIDKLTRNARKV